MRTNDDDKDKDDEDEDQYDEDEDETNLWENGSDFNDLETKNDESHGETWSSWSWRSPNILLITWPVKNLPIICQLTWFHPSPYCYFIWNVLYKYYM